MAAEKINILPKKPLAPEIPLASQPKPVVPPAVKPQTPIQTLTNTTGIIKTGTSGIQNTPTNNINGPLAPNPAQTNASPLYQKSAAPNPTPWNDSSGGFNKSYGAGLSDTDYNNAIDYLRRDYTDSNAQSKIAQITANYKGLNTTSSSGINTNPTSADDAVAAQKAKNEEDKSILDQQIQAATLKAQSNTGTAIDTINATTGAVNRNGITSVGNQMAASTGINNLKADYNTYATSLANQKQQLSEAQAAGNTQLASQLGQSIASTQAVMQSHASDQLALVQNLASTGVLNNATPDQIQQYAAQYGVDPTMLQSVQKTAQAANASDNQKIQAANLSSAVDTFTKLNTAGVPITPDIIASTAQATGVNPAFLQSAAAGYNQTVQAIQNDKNLDAQTRQVALNQANQKLSDDMNGYTTQAAQAGRDLAAAYSRGDMTTVGIIKNAYPSISDPMEQAKLQYQMAQTDDERQKAYTDAINNGLDPGAVMSNTSGSGYKTIIDPQTGKYDIQGAENGTNGGQCGHFVNQVFGSNVMGDAYTQKLSKCDPEVGFGEGQTPPQPGMAFVMPITGKSSDNGHTGIFLGVDPKNSSMALVKDSNWGENEVIQTHSIPLSEITGFASPPNATQTNGAVGSLTREQILKNADAQGIDTGKTVAEKNQYVASIQSQGFLPGSQATSDTSDDNASLIKGLANYDIDPQSLSARLPKGATDSQRTAIIKEAQKLNPNYSEGNYAAGKAFRDSWSGAPTAGSYAFQNNSANTAIKHLGTLYDVFQDMKNGGVIDANGMANYIKVHAGDPHIAAYLAVKPLVATELAKASSGGVPSESETNEISNSLSENSSPDQLLATIKAQMDLMSGKIKTNVSQYKRTVGDLPSDPILDDTSIAALKKIGLNPNDYDPTLSANKSSSTNGGLSSILGGLFSGNNTKNATPVTAGEFTLPAQGGGHIDSTQHIDTNNL